MTDSGSIPPPPPPPQGPGGPGSYPPPPPGAYGGGYGGPPAYGAPRTNPKSIWALVLGIVGLLCCGFFTGIPAIILGKMAQNEIDASHGGQTGRGMATAGFILGIIAVVWGIINVILFATGVIDYNFSTSSSST